MTIDLDDIESRINEGIYGDDRMTDTGRDDAFSALAALVAEVERLRSINDDYLLEMGRQHALLRDQAREAKTERAAVVAYLRELGEINSMLSPMKGAADDIEDGEHRREVGE